VAGLIRGDEVGHSIDSARIAAIGGAYAFLVRMRWRLNLQGDTDTVKNRLNRKFDFAVRENPRARRSGREQKLVPFYYAAVRELHRADAIARVNEASRLFIDQRHASGVSQNRL